MQQLYLCVRFFFSYYTEMGEFDDRFWFKAVLTISRQQFYNRASFRLKN